MKVAPRHNQTPKTEVLRARVDPWLKQKFQMIAQVSSLDESDHVRLALIDYAERNKITRHHVTR